MTDGTSQGLFIVVAIVIFGVFVVMAYILFEDTLSPAMASMFTDATETATQKLVSSNYYHVSGLVPNANSDFEFDTPTGTILNYIGESTVVVIPYEIDGVPVVNLGDYSFKNKNLNKVYIPNTVKAIRAEALNTNNLKELHIPDSVTSIGREVFESNLLEHVHIGRGLVSISNESFRNNNLKTVEIPPNIKQIGAMAFSYNPIETFTVPETVDTIGIRVIGFKVSEENNITLKEYRLPKKFVGNTGIIAYFSHSGTYPNEGQVNRLFDSSLITYY